MTKTKLYEKARKNEFLKKRIYSTKEINEIIQAQFHYFWYNVNTKQLMDDCAFANFDEEQLGKIKNQILIFRNNNIYIFKKKNEIKLFNTVIFHLLLNKQYIHSKKLTKL